MTVAAAEGLVPIGGSLVTLALPLLLLCLHVLHLLVYWNSFIVGM